MPAFNGMEYTLVRSSRRTLAIEVALGGKVTVRAPKRCAQREIDRFLEERKAWIAEKTERQRAAALARPEPDGERREELIALAKAVLPQRVEYYSAIMGLVPTGVKITGARKRFGSCNAQNSLCFSWRLMQYPQEAVDYVVVHELAHIARKDHSRAFYSIVAAAMPDYKARKKLLSAIPNDDA